MGQFCHGPESRPSAQPNLAARFHGDAHCAKSCGAHLSLCPSTTSSLGTHVTFGDLRASLAQLPRFTAGDTEAPNHSPDSLGKQEALFSSSPYSRTVTVQGHRHLHKHTRLQVRLLISQSPREPSLPSLYRLAQGTCAGRTDSVTLTASVTGHCVGDVAFAIRVQEESCVASDRHVFVCAGLATPESSRVIQDGVAGSRSSSGLVTMGAINESINCAHVTDP